MKITFFGTRGSIPSPSGRLPDGSMFLTDEFGGNTTCCLVENTSNIKHILDAGTGIRNLGLYLARLKKLKKEQLDINLYITHTHWDHIQGFPFFGPAYDSTNNISIYGEAKLQPELVNTAKSHSDAPGYISSIFKIKDVGIEDVLKEQQKFRNFPAPLAAMKGIKNVYDFLPGNKIMDLPDLEIHTFLLNHPGGCVSYKFIDKKNSKVFIFSTDFEPDNNGLDDKLVEWWENADVVVADAQYEKDSEINPFMVGWGHSDYKSDIDLAVKAGVKYLILTHHEPRMDDEYHRSLEKKAIEYADGRIMVELAREGKTINI